MDQADQDSARPPTEQFQTRATASNDDGGREMCFGQVRPMLSVLADGARCVVVHLQPRLVRRFRFSLPLALRGGLQGAAGTVREELFLSGPYQKFGKV